MSRAGPIPGVTVTVTNQDTGIARAAIADANGFYSAKALQVGTYSVTAELAGMQTTQQSDVSVLVGQIKDVNLTLEVESTSEVITVTSEAPIIEVSRSGAANYIDEVAIESLPIVGRDFTDFAILTPGVQRDRSRGFLTMAGQRGMYSGLSVDGADNKSTFFGYGRGGEATENDGLIIAQDTVRQFQVITNGFSAEYGRHGGAFVNVVTKSGTNDLRGSAFYQFRDDSMAEDLPSSPLDDHFGNDGSRPVDTFDTQNYGFSIGGPFKQDRTHYYFGIDQRDQDIPFTRSLRTRGSNLCSVSMPDECGTYDLIMLRAQNEPAFAALVDGFDRNADGSATGLFTRSVSNQILFGKLDHQISDANLISLRANWTDFERESDFLDEESLKTEDTLSIIASMTSVVGSRGVNEFRFQSATDNLDRLSLRVGTPIEAQVPVLLRFSGQRRQVRLPADLRRGDAAPGQERLLLPVRRSRHEVRRRLLEGRSGAALRGQPRRPLRLRLGGGLPEQRAFQSANLVRRLHVSELRRNPGGTGVLRSGQPEARQHDDQLRPPLHVHGQPGRPRASPSRRSRDSGYREPGAALRLRPGPGRGPLRAPRRHRLLLRPHANAAVRQPDSGQRRTAELRPHHGSSRPERLRAARDAD